MEEEKRGRNRISNEDKAQTFSILLHKFHKNLLEYIPGSNNSVKIRNLLEAHPRYIQRTKRQIEGQGALLNKLFSLGDKWHNPKYANRRREIENVFLEGFERFLEMESLLDLSEEEYRMFSSKEFLDKRRSVILKYGFIQKSNKGDKELSLPKTYEKGVKNELS